MELNNETLDKVNEARKVVEEFTAEVIKRARVWLVANSPYDFNLPAADIIFGQDGWVVELADLNKILNGTEGAPVQFVYYNRDLRPLRLTFEVPEDAIFPKN